MGDRCGVTRSRKLAPCDKRSRSKRTDPWCYRAKGYPACAGQVRTAAAVSFEPVLSPPPLANPLKVNRGDRIRTCDLVLPKQVRGSAPENLLQW